MANLGIALLDGVLVYLDTRVTRTYSIRSQFSYISALQCTRESHSCLVVPWLIHCHWNLSSECWGLWVGAYPLHHCQDRRRKGPIRCRRNAGQFEQHSIGRTSRFVLVQVLTLYSHEHWIREPAVESDSAYTYTLFGSIDSKHKYNNAYCYLTCGGVSCHSIGKWNVGK